MNGIDYSQMSFERAITIGEKLYWNKGIANITGKMLSGYAKQADFRRFFASTRK